MPRKYSEKMRFFKYRGFKEGKRKEETTKSKKGVLKNKKEKTMVSVREAPGQQVFGGEMKDEIGLLLSRLSCETKDEYVEIYVDAVRVVVKSRMAEVMAAGGVKVIMTLFTRLTLREATTNAERVSRDRLAKKLAEIVFTIVESPEGLNLVEPNTVIALLTCKHWEIGQKLGCLFAPVLFHADFLPLLENLAINANTHELQAAAKAALTAIVHENQLTNDLSTPALLEILQNNKPPEEENDALGDNNIILKKTTPIVFIGGDLL